MDVNKASDILSELEISFEYDMLNLRVDFLKIYPFKPGEGFDWHSHSDYEFHYIKEGSGGVYLQNEEYPLSAGSFYLTAPGVLHKQYADNNFPMLEYALKCSINMNKEPGMTVSSEEELSYIMKLLNCGGNRVVQDRNDLNSHFEAAFKEAYYKKPGYFFAIKTSIINIILASARNFAGENANTYSIPTRDLDIYRFETIKGYILDNISKNITRREVANYICLSIRHTDRVIRSQTGVSIHNFIMNERIICVKKLLTITRDNLASIAEQTGFASEYHLSGSFKKITGVSPTKYRKELSEGKSDAT